MLTLVQLAVLALPTAGSGEWPLEKKLTAGVVSQGQFGTSVALDGDTALVGSPWDDPSGPGSGSVVVYRRSGTSWTQETKLKASDGATSDHFGLAVAFEGDRAVVGAPDDDGVVIGVQAGSVYVFQRSGTVWSEDAKLVASDQGVVDNFGAAVSLEGGVLVVGAPNDKDLGEDSGSVYVFTWSGTDWVESAKLLASNGASGHRLGSALSLSGDTVLIGTGGKPEAAYVFRGSGSSWNEEAILSLAVPNVFDAFGSSVALQGDRALVGASESTGNGSAYVFQRSGTVWTQDERLVASDGENGDRFGGSVSLYGDTALIGAPHDKEGPTNYVGSAYVFQRVSSAWFERDKLTAVNPAPRKLGEAVAFHGSTALVGAPDGEASYVFVEPPPAGTVYCTSGTSASGCRAQIGATGQPSATASSGFQIEVLGVEGSKNGHFYFGTNGQQANPWGNGTSYQCVVPPSTRGGALTGTGTTGACDGAQVQDLNALWCSTCPKPQKNPGAGAVVQAQFWYRDPQNTSNRTSSISDAIEFPVGP